MQDKQNKRGFIAIIAAFFIPAVVALFYLHLRLLETSYDRTIFENAVRQTALEVARQRVQKVSIGDQYPHLSRVAVTTFNDLMKAKTGLTVNLTTLTNKVVQYGMVGRDEYEHISSLETTYNSTIVHRHMIFSNFGEYRYDDFSDEYDLYPLDPDADQTIDSGFLDKKERGSVLKNRQYSSVSTTKTFCAPASVKKTSNTIDISDDNSNEIKISDDNGVISVEIKARFGKYNKLHTAKYKAISPKLNMDMVFCIPVNSSASDEKNRESPTTQQIENTHMIDYKLTPIWQIKEAARNLFRKMLSYSGCSVGIIPYCGNVNLTGCSSASTQAPDKRTQLFPQYDYKDYDAVNPQIPIAEGLKYGSYNSSVLTHLSDQSTNIHYIPGSYRTYTPILYRADMNPLLDQYMNDGSGGDQIERLLYSLVVGSENGGSESETIFMARALDMNPAGNLNVLAGYSPWKVNTYPTPYPMYGLSEKLIEMYRYMVIFAPFMHHENRSHFLYLPIMFGASMLKNNFLKSKNYTLDVNDQTRQKVLILISNKDDTFAPHELTYFGLSNDASCITLVNGDKLDFSKGVYTETTQTDANNNTITKITGTLEKGSDGYYRNKLFTSSDYGTSVKDGVLKTNYNSGYNAGQFYSDYEKQVQIASNYLYKTDENTDGTYTLKMPQPGNLKFVLSSQVDLTNMPYAKVFINNKHNSGVTIRDLTTTNSIVKYISSTSGDYYQCRVMSADEASDFEISLDNTSLRTNPVLAQIELIGCEVDSVTNADGSSDSNYIFYQDSDYVYICYKSASANPAIDINSGFTKIKLKIKQATSATQHTSLAYSGRMSRSSYSNETLSPPLTEYHTGNIFNWHFCGNFKYDISMSRSYAYDKSKTWHNAFYAGDYYYSAGPSYVPDKYGIRVMRRFYLADDTDSSGNRFSASAWKTNLDSNWSSYSSWSGYSETTGTTKALTNIKMTFAGDTSAGVGINEEPLAEHIPHVRIYKKNGHNDVEIDYAGYLLDNSSYTNRYFVDAGDYYVLYSSSGRDISCRLRIKNPNGHNTVYVKMETFGLDIHNDSLNTYEFRQDSNYLYLCSNGTTQTQFDLKFEDSSSFKESASIDYRPFSASCTCGALTKVNDTKYMHSMELNSFGSTPECTISCSNSKLDITDSINGVKHNSYTRSFSDLGSVNASILIQDETTEELYYEFRGTHYIEFDPTSYLEVAEKVEGSFEAENVILSLYGGVSFTEVPGNSNGYYYSFCEDIEVDSLQHGNFSIYKDGNFFEFCANIGSNYITKSTTVPQDYLDLLASHQISFRIEASPIFDETVTKNILHRYSFRPSDYNTVDTSETVNGTSVATITRLKEYANVTRKYRSASDKAADGSDAVVFKLPQIWIYKKPGYYVPSIEGELLSGEYETVSKVEKGATAGYIEYRDDVDGEGNAGWKCYSTGGATYDSTTKQWGFDDSKTEILQLKISYVENLPAYPVLVKFRCFHMNALTLPGTDTDPSQAYVRQDGKAYYLCSVSKRESSDRNTAKATELPVLESKPTKTSRIKWDLAFANMCILDRDNRSDLIYECNVTPTSTNPYHVYGYNCKVTPSVTFSGTDDPSFYYVYNYILNDLLVYATTSAENYNSTYKCFYRDVYFSFNGHPTCAYQDSLIAGLPDIHHHGASSTFTRTFKPINSSNTNTSTSGSIAFSGAYSASYKLEHNHSVIFIPRDKLSSNELKFTLSGAKVLSIEWSNHLNGVEGCYACDDATGNNAKVNATQLAAYYEPIKPGKNCRWADPNKKGSGGESSLPWFHEHIGVETATNYGVFSWSSDSGGYANTEDTNENYLYIARSNSSDIATIRLHSDETGSGYTNSSTHGDFNVILNNVNSIPYINVWFAKSDGTHVDEYTYINGVGRYCQAEHSNNMTGTSDESQLSMVLSDSNQKLRIAGIECTNEVNRILMAIGAQTCSVSTTQQSNDLPNKSPSKALQDTVTPEMIKKFHQEIPNGRIYVIHYRKAEQRTPQEIGNVYKNYYVKDLDTMNEALCEILNDIEEFAGFSDAKIVE